MSDLPRPTPKDVHNMDQRWAQAKDSIEMFITYLTHDLPALREIFGIDGDTSAAVFDYADGCLSYHVKKFFSVGLNDDEMMVLLRVMLAAALTKLVMPERDCAQMPEGMS